jgi:queuine tRNA-ribosyltransferase
MFKIISYDKKTKARVGILQTPHGKIETPSYVMVATHAKIKALKSTDIKKTKTQVVISNTYHLWEQALKRGAKNVVHKTLGVKIPAMTDSGGFQVFSLGFGMENKVGKILSGKEEKIKEIKRQNIKITKDGVYFTIDGKKKFLGPKLSMKIQEKLGADIIFVFDECTSPLDNFKYNKEALIKTHKWAEECLDIKARNKKMDKQKLFGIVQGGKYKSLREKSAKHIGALPFDGFGIGGSFGKDEMAQTLEWVIPHLPEDKPKHLLGIGKIEDIFSAVENGVDTFDCVIPTREGRHGRIWTRKGHYDIRKGIYTNSKKRLESRCSCPTCKNITQAYLYKLFKSSSPMSDMGLGGDLFEAERYATIHNIWFFNNLVEDIRTSIKRGKFSEFKKEVLGGLK